MYSVAILPQAFCAADRAADFVLRLAMDQLLRETLDRLKQNDPTLVILELVGKSFRIAGARAIAGALRENSTLQKLYLGGNRIGN